MTDLEVLHLALYDLALNQKQLHNQMLLEGRAKAADNAWECYEELKVRAAMAAQLVAAQP